jgi:hypothetical protein
VDDVRILPACCALALALLAGCATPTPSGDGAPSAALEDLATPDAQTPPSSRQDLAQATRQAADDMAELMSQLSAQKRPTPAIEATGSQRPWQAPGEQNQTPAEAPATDPVAAEQPGEPALLPSQAVAAQPAPARDPIAEVLERLEADAKEPDRALAAAILARAIRGYADADDGSRPGQSLSPPERELAELLGPLLDALATGDRADAPSRIGLAIDDANRKLASVLPVRINDAALATDIYGFAAYKPFDNYRFLAGRNHRVLLYTEPAQFESRLTAEPQSQSSATNPGAYEVLLGLELRLYNERGSMLAWRRTEERVSIRSDRPRTEIYLGTLIDLPDRLTVGRYQLKVVLRDHADGSEDERVIPIEIVADPRLTTRATRTP